MPLISKLAALPRSRLESEGIMLLQIMAVSCVADYRRKNYLHLRISSLARPEDGHGIFVRNTVHLLTAATRRRFRAALDHTEKRADASEQRWITLKSSR